MHDFLPPPNPINSATDFHRYEVNGSIWKHWNLKK